MSDGHKELAFAPWPSLVVALSIPLLYLFQLAAPDQGALISIYGLSAQGLRASHYQELLTFLVLHGSWIHVGGNTFFAVLFAATFGGAMTRLMGAGWRGVLAFFSFYVFCGVISGVAFVATNLHSNYVVIGASGAVSGLLGAGARLFNRTRRPGSWLSPGLWAMALSFLALNLLVSPVQGGGPETGMPVAWVTHLAGFLAGLLLVGSWAAVFGEPQPRTAQAIPPPYESMDHIPLPPERPVEPPLEVTPLEDPVP